MLSYISRAFKNTNNYRNYYADFANNKTKAFNDLLILYNQFFIERFKKIKKKIANAKLETKDMEDYID